VSGLAARSMCHRDYLVTKARAQLALTLDPSEDFFLEIGHRNYWAAVRALERAKRPKL
jgi:hypothetical protein